MTQPSKEGFLLPTYLHIYKSALLYVHQLNGDNEMQYQPTMQQVQFFEFAEFSDVINSPFVTMNLEIRCDEKANTLGYALVIRFDTDIDEIGAVCEDGCNPNHGTQDSTPVQVN